MLAVVASLLLLRVAWVWTTLGPPWSYEPPSQFESTVPQPQVKSPDVRPPEPKPEPKPEASDSKVYLPERPEPGSKWHKDKIVLPELVESKEPARVTFDELMTIRKHLLDGSLPEVPAEFRALDGKTLTVRGFLIIPFIAEPLTEFYVGKHPWDTCCIGKPPTVFNSVAVRMAEQSRLKNSRVWIVNLRGTFHVRPVHENDLLTELFSLTDAVEVATE